MRLLFALFLVAVPVQAQWKEVAPGVSYRRFVSKGIDVHVARIDVTKADLVASPESERGTTVRAFAEKSGAIVAVNANFFTPQRQPLGLAVGPCGRWPDSRDDRRHAVIAFGADRVEMFSGSRITEMRPWMRSAVGGFPVLVSDCRARSADELPGPRRFTHAKHPRTAIGFSRDRKTLFLVVADGRRPTAPGMTLPALAAWMFSELGVCSALNLDGGGSSTMWIDGRVVNQPGDGFEERVANHLAVVPRGTVVKCDQVSGPK